MLYLFRNLTSKTSLKDFYFTTEEEGKHKKLRTSFLHKNDLKNLKSFNPLFSFK